MADITEMFHQVIVRTDNQPALTFLWRNCNTSRPPYHYRMQAAIFGARCSQATASYVLQKTADDQIDENAFSKGGAAALRNSFYKDDFLRSKKTTADAKIINQEVMKIVSSGGFPLTKWVSSHPFQRCSMAP